jgi:hypothetical protein
VRRLVPPDRFELNVGDVVEGVEDGLGNVELWLRGGLPKTLFAQPRNSRTSIPNTQALTSGRSAPIG